jgi:tetratricopeptide (TPR) repeat protein/predicted Ser/Thr protein kinase
MIGERNGARGPASTGARVDTICDRFEGARREGDGRPLEDWLPPEPGLRGRALVELVRLELQLRLAAGEPARAEEYLTRFPELASDPAKLLRVAAAEFQQRRRAEPTLTADEYRRRFPRLVAHAGWESVFGVPTTAHRPRANGAAKRHGPVPSPRGGELPAIPGYEVLEELGRGGMGIVYKARQMSLDRVVAVKMILAGADARPEELERFRTEAEMIACLQHPNIVQVFEVGEHAGRPFFSLEFVEGESLDRALHGTPRPALGSAQLVETLARAVQCVHERGIVHRDLKPANVLLRADGAPKVTDFGLAKCLKGVPGRTRTGAVVGTPSYMAPEQARGEGRQIGPAADVYALGAILYELLTGRPPFLGETAFDTVSQVLYQEPVPPSRVVAKVPGDLERICLKCLRKEPSRRYGSAGELADDLRRFQVGLPVLARPVGAGERALKWAKRQPAAAAAAAVSGIAALALLGVILLSNISLQRERDHTEEQRRQAVVNLKKAREAVDRMLTRVADRDLRNVPQMEKVQGKLLQDAVEFYQALSRQKSDDPELRHETGRAFRRLGNLQSWQGQPARAEASFRRAVALQERLCRDWPRVPAYRHELANSQHNLGQVLRNQEQHAPAEEALTQALDVLRQLIREEPDEPGFQVDLASASNSLGVLLSGLHRPKEEEEAYREAIRVLAELTRRFPEEPEHRFRLASARNNLAAVMEGTSRRGEAEAILKQNEATLRGLVARHPDELRYRSRLALTLSHLGDLLVNDRRPGEAERAYGEAAKLRRRMADDFPYSPHYKRELGDALKHLGVLAGKRGEGAEACRLLKEAIDHQQAAVRLAPTSQAYRRTLCAYHVTLAETLLQAGNHAEAAEAAAASARRSSQGCGEHFQAAWLLARCAPLAQRDASLAETSRRELALAYATRALRSLWHACLKGFGDTRQAAGTAR